MSMSPREARSAGLVWFTLAMCGAWTSLLLGVLNGTLHHLLAATGFALLGLVWYRQPASVALLWGGARHLPQYTAESAFALTVGLVLIVSAAAVRFFSLDGRGAGFAYLLIAMAVVAGVYAYWVVSRAMCGKRGD